MRPSLKKLEAVLGQLDAPQWRKQCHSASLTLVKSGLLPKGARVARGFHPSVRGQHSWVVFGGKHVYDEEAIILDPTLWQYEACPPRIVMGTARDLPHRPHGAGNIWEYGRPADPTGPVIKVKGQAKLSPAALDFLARAAPKGLDWRGWSVLANSPMQGWPSAEIIAAMYDDKKLQPAVPIDIVGMLTDRNPGGLYF